MSTRRQFMQHGTAAAVAAATGVFSSTTRGQDAAGGDRLRIGAIGVGNQGEVNLRQLRDENIVALCDVDRQMLDAARRLCPDAATYRDWRKMLQRDDLDAVVVSTPDHTHAVAAIAAMRRGLHVYCEKPLAHNVHEVRAMAELAQEMKLATQMGNQNHARAGFRRAVEWLQSDALGPVAEVHCWTDRPIWEQGIDRPLETPPVPETLDWDLWLGPAPQRPYHPTYHPLTWRGWWDFGTGALGDMGPHLIDAVVWGLDLAMPERIEAASAPVNNETGPVWSIVRFLFPARQTLPAVSLIWYDGTRKPSRETTGIDRLPPSGALAIGERGNLFIPDQGRVPMLLPHGDDERPDEPEAFLPDSPGHHQEWVLACKTGSPTGSDFAYGARLSEICLLGNIALRLGKSMQWDASRSVSPNCPEAAALLRRPYRDGWSL